MQAKLIRSLNIVIRNGEGGAFPVRPLLRKEIRELEIRDCLLNYTLISNLQSLIS